MMSSTPNIFQAACEGNIEVLQELIDIRADLNVRDDKGHTPLIIACYNRKYTAAKLLIDHRADVNAMDNGGNTALMGAAFKGYEDIAKLLIDNGAHVDLQYGNGGSALMFAAMFGRHDLLRLVLASGGDKHLLDMKDLSSYDIGVAPVTNEPNMGLDTVN